MRANFSVIGLTLGLTSSLAALAEVNTPQGPPSILVDTTVGVDPPAYAVVSSAFTDASLGGFHTAGADDFSVPQCGWKIDRVRAYGSYQDPLSAGQTGPANSLNVFLLPKTGAVPTSTNLSALAVWSATDLAYAELDLVNGGDFEIDLLDAVFPQGDYWLVVQPNIALFERGQWSWTESALTPNSGTTLGDESTWFQSAAGVASPITGTATCVGSWSARVTTCSMTRNPDTNPPADRDFAFQLEGTALMAGVQASQTNLVTVENGSSVSYSLVLTAAPNLGETVTITPSSNDLTEGMVSGALDFNQSNWNVPQLVTVTPGASGDGNDGDVAYSIDHSVTSNAGCFVGASAPGVAVTNNNIEGIATIIVDPSSAITVSEDGTITQVVAIGAAPDVTPAADVTVSLTNDTPSAVSLSVPSVSLTAGNGYSATVTITGVADDVVETAQAFSITTNAATSADVAYNGANPVDITGVVQDSNSASVTVTPSATPLVTTELGGTATISYVLTAQPTDNVSFNLTLDDSSEASLSHTTLVFNLGNWDTPQVVTVTGLDDFIDDGTQTYNVIAQTTTSNDPFWAGLSVAAVAGGNADDADMAGFTVDAGGGVATAESGSTDSFTVVLNSEPIANVALDFTSQNVTEGLLGALGGPYAAARTVQFTPANWNVPQTIEVQGQDDLIADGAVAYAVTSGNVVSTDSAYSAIADAAIADVAASNADNEGPAGIVFSPSNLMLSEGGAAAQFLVRLATQPSGPVTIPILSSDLSEATVAPASLNFDASNWNVDQVVTVTPLSDGIADGDIAVQITIGPAAGGGYDGLTQTVSAVVANVATEAPIPGLGPIGMLLLALLIALSAISMRQRLNWA